MIRASLTMKVKEGREGDFEQAWGAVAARVRLFPGSLRQALLRDPQNPALFVITSDWVNSEAFSRFEQSAEQDALTAPLRALRESAMMTMYQLVAHIEKEIES